MLRRKSGTPFLRYAAASALAEAIRDEKPDLVLTGLQSDDFGYGQTGVILAEISASRTRR